MRIRRKAWARPEFDACPFFVKQPALNRGRWAECFDNAGPLHLEVGCGKGAFIAQLALQNPDIHYLAFDIKSDMLGVARRKIVQLFGSQGKEVQNLLLSAVNVEQIETVLAPEDGISRIYINFCNPWPREKHKKRRLTHPRQLKKYQSFLTPRGEIHFKTDDAPLFEDSVSYLEQCGFELLYRTDDLHAAGIEGNIETEHEQMFSEQGIPIHFLIAKWPG